MTSLLPGSPGNLFSVHEVGAEASSLKSLVALWLGGKSSRTIAAYSSDLRDFSAFLSVSSTEEAARLLVGDTRERATETVIRYRIHLLERGLASATINRRLASVRSLVELARKVGLIDWRIDVPNCPAFPYRDTRGPRLTDLAKIMDRVTENEGPKSRRDCAILRLLFDLGLRRGEVASLDLENLSDDLEAVWIRGKGRRELQLLSLPEKTKDALRAWIEVRGEGEGALFHGMNHFRRTRLTPEGIYYIVREHGRSIGIRLTPHMIRHAAITVALDSSRDLRAVQRFSRHADPRVMMIYDDNREDLAGEIASLVADQV